MHLIVCLDDQNGMCFHHRRQSRDRALRKRMLDRINGQILWMNAYSSSQFSGENARIRVDEHFPEKAGAGEYCFVEDLDVSPFRERIESVTVYRWNRQYPADLFFPAFWLITPDSVFEFVGTSHDKLTEEVYVL